MSAAKEISRKVREVRKLMEGGNGVSEANVVTLCSKGEMPYCVSQKRPLDGVCLGRQRYLSRKERKGRKEIFKTSRTSSAPPHLRVRFARASRTPARLVF